MRISDWSSDVCSSDLSPRQAARFSRYRVMSGLAAGIARTQWVDHHCKADLVDFHHWQGAFDTMLGAGLSAKGRSEEHNSHPPPPIPTPHALSSSPQKHHPHPPPPPTPHPTPPPP